MTTPLPHMGRTFLLWKGIKLVLRQAKEWFDAYHLQLNDERTQHFLCTLKSVADSDAEGSTSDHVPDRPISLTSNLVGDIACDLRTGKYRSEMYLTISVHFWQKNKNISRDNA
ncbi:hypothetical protein J6590_022695 [Homalodisca vitripennis]|nr:hypothetical protein J6590_022695 [Homalodisca vitripennis]